MIFIVVGLNHATALLELRERLAFSPGQAMEALAQLPPGVEQGAILSTCNRVEVYAIAQEKAGEALTNFLNRGRLPLWLLNSYVYTYTQEKAIEHLFQVVSGIDSLVLGEDQIQGQVGQALELALKVGNARRQLSYLLRRALEVGKRVRRETGISRYNVSVSWASVLLARQLLGELKDRSVLIISAGETGGLTGKIVKESGVGRILVTNRTLARAEELAQKLGGVALPFDHLAQALVECDMVISSTSAPGYVLDARIIREAMGRRQGRPLCLIDIAVPRDIDPRVKEVPRVFLYNIDDLQAISQAGLEERKREAIAAQAIVREEVARTMQWWQQEEVVPTIIALRQRAEALRHRELRRTMKNLSELSPHERDHLEALSRAIVNKLLHHTISHLKGDSHYRDVVRELFDLPQEAPEG